MNNKYESFREIIKNCDYDNTYKMAWGKSLIEMSLKLDLSKDKIIIRLEDIAEKYIKYYWNQIIFFDLKQATNSNKIPTIIVIIKELIDKCYEHTNEMILKSEKISRVTFEKLNLLKEYDDTIKSIIKVLKQDVSWRFLLLDGKNTNIYDYVKGNDYIQIESKLLKKLKENNEELLNIINYRWLLILKNINGYGNINKKVKLFDDDTINKSLVEVISDIFDI